MCQTAPIASFRQVLNRFKKDRGGVAALEFAMIAPMMFLLLFVSFEVTDAAAANRRAEVAAGSIADVISRDILVTDDEVDGVFAAVPWLTYPTDGARVQARITSVFIDASGRAQVAWSEAFGMAPLAAGAAVAIPDGLLIPETGLVIGETTVAYEPPLGLFSSKPFTITKVEYRRARVVDPVLRDER